MKRTLVARFGLPVGAALVTSTVIAAFALGGTPVQLPAPAAGGQPAGQLLIDGKTISVLSFSAGVSNPVTIGTSGGGAGAGKASFSSLNIMTPLDANAPELHEAVAKGEAFPTAVLTATSIVGGTSTTWKYELENVVLESIQESGSAGNTTQSISMAYAKVKWTYIDANGTTTGGWNLVSNTP
jgi:type VI secretion system secreted protein Hcp